jgi:hypothetical protein
MRRRWIVRVRRSCDLPLPRDATAPHWFRVVCDSGFRRIQALADILRTLEPEKRRIKHLLINHEGALREHEHGWLHDAR